MSFTVPAGRCPRCFVKQAYCLCASVPRVETRTRFVIVQHAVERRKTSNTARLAALALPRAEIVHHAVPGGPPLEGAAIAPPGAWLLFPDGTPVERLPAPPAVLVVVDGTWAQARRMVQRVPALRTLPRLALRPPAAPVRRLRAPSRADGMSTLEAIAWAVAALEGEATARPLHELYALLVRRTLAAYGAV